MTFWRLFRTCVLRSRCPLCAEGALFAGPLRMHEACPVCGLGFDQWAGEWVSPTCLASSLGLVVAFAIASVMFATQWGLDGPVPAELPVAGAAGAVALAALRPAKAFWLAVLYAAGGIEVSAETRARLRWTELARDATRVREAERHARRVRPPRPALGVTLRRFVSLRELLLPRRVRGGPPTAPAGTSGAGGRPDDERGPRPVDAHR